VRDITHGERDPRESDLHHVSIATSAKTPRSSNNICCNANSFYRKSVKAISDVRFAGYTGWRASSPLVDYGKSLTDAYADS
jgi:hypothetical protein